MKPLPILPALLLAAGLAWAAPALAQAPDPARAMGLWRTPSGDSLIRISRCGASLCGSVAKILAGETRDVNNPDPALRSRSLVGVALVSGMRPAGDGWEGSLYNFRDGKTYSGKLAVQAPNALELSGCVLGGLICKKQVWSRVE